MRRAAGLTGSAAPRLSAAEATRRARFWRSTPSRSTSAVSVQSPEQVSVRRRRNPRADRAERRRQDHLFNLISGMFPARSGPCISTGREFHASRRPHLPAGPLAFVPDHQSVPIAFHLRERAPFSAGAASARFNLWRDIDRYPEIHAESAELIRFLGLDGIEDVEGGDFPMAGSGCSISGSRSAPSRGSCCWTSRLPGSQPQSASASRICVRWPHTSADRRTRHRPRTWFCIA